MSAELLTTVPVGNTLGEGVLWNEQRQEVWWTDIESRRLFAYDPGADKYRSWQTPQRVASFGFVEGSRDLIVAFARGIAIYDVEAGIREWLVRPGRLAAGIRFNDGRVDDAGRFWVGTMVESRSAQPGSAGLYRLDPAEGLVEMLSGITISNGICWSPAGDVMYFADSVTRTMRAFRFEMHAGTLAAPVPFAECEAGIHPDGSTVDRDGGVWNAQWGGSRVVRYAPSGELSLGIDLPVSQPTCVTFGGAGLDMLFVTSASAGLRDADRRRQPRAGDLFVYRVNYRGRAAPRFKYPGTDG